MRPSGVILSAAKSVLRQLLKYRRPFNVGAVKLSLSVTQPLHFPFNITLAQRSLNTTGAAQTGLRSRSRVALGTMLKCFACVIVL